MTKRAKIGDRTKLAAALLALGVIPYEDAKAMGETNFLSLFQFDHYPIRKTDGGSDEFWNLQPLTIMAHRGKTSKIDVPAIAKTKRIIAGTAIHEALMASKAGDYEGAAKILATAPKPKRGGRKIASRPFAKGHRPLRSRNTFDRRVT